MRRVELVVEWVFKLIPVVVLFSPLFALDGALRWIGLLGIVPLIFALRRDCPSCCARARPGQVPDNWPTWIGH